MTAQGRIDSAVALLDQVPDAALREWYVEHAQNAGRHRSRVLRVPRPSPYQHDIDPRSQPDSATSRAILERDGYRCRYCGGKIIATKVLTAFARALPPGAFTATGPGNDHRSGAALVYRGVLDHVVPRSLGGRTDDSNLVTSCFPCNFGKAGFTIDQIGIRNPFEGPVQPSTWGGLVEHLDPLRTTARST